MKEKREPSTTKLVLCKREKLANTFNNNDHIRIKEKDKKFKVVEKSIQIIL